MALVAAGAALPVLTDSRLLLNLHLLRAAALTWWLATLLALAAIAALVQPRVAGRRRPVVHASSQPPRRSRWSGSTGRSRRSRSRSQPPRRRPAAVAVERQDLALAGTALVLVVADVALARVTLENVPEIVASMMAIVAALAMAAAPGRRGALVLAGAVCIAAYLLASTVSTCRHARGWSPRRSSC